MSRHFERDFASDLLTLSAGGLSGVDGGPITIVIVFRADGVSNDQVLIRARDSGNVKIWGVSISGGQLFYETGGFVGCSSGLTANTWYMWAVTKASGTAQVRDHLCVMTAGTDTWTHTDRGTMPDGTGTVDHIRMSDGTGSARLDGYIAAEAVWSSVLSDAAIEALRPGLAAWNSAAPAAMWRLNDTPVNDLRPGGANQTAIDGTTVDTGVEPPAFGYTLGQVVALGAATEADTAQTLGRVKTRTLGTATSTEIALPVGRRKTRAVGVAVETDTAMAVTTPGGRITPRPAAGTTSRPNSGITARPFAGVTPRP